MSQDTFMFNQSQLSAHANEIQGHHGRLVTVMEDVRKSDHELINKGKEGWESATQAEFSALQKKWEAAYREFNEAVQKFKAKTVANGENVTTTENKMLGMIS